MKTSGFQTSLSDPEGKHRTIQPIKLKTKQTIEYILPIKQLQRKRLIYNLTLVIFYFKKNGFYALWNIITTTNYKICLEKYYSLHPKQSIFFLSYRNITQINPN
jgi:hypothetical protein